MADLVQLVRKHSKFSAAAGLLGFLTIILYSHIHIIMAAWTLIAGVVFCYFVFSPDTLIPNLLLMHIRKWKSAQLDDDELLLRRKICPVCGRTNCGRHRELNIIALQPWTNLKVPKKVDIALEEFANLVLKKFVYTWYRDLSEDESFVDELRTNLRFITAVLLRRLKKVDLPTLVTDKIMREAIRHLDFVLRTRKKVGPVCDVTQATIDLYGPQLHCAMRSRKMELEYLRKVSDAIFPHILPKKSLECKSLISLLREIISGAILLPIMDVLADPDMVNQLLLIFFDDTPPPLPTEPPSPNVTILCNLAKPLNQKTSFLHLQLQDILDEPTILYPFMRFLTNEASVNVLQFCLSVDEFNNRILNPELGASQIVELHMEAKELYHNYCAPDAVDKILFEEDLVRQLKEITEGPPEGVIKLRTTTPLFQAYEHAYNLLENVFLPLFHQSDDYYQMTCGDRLQTRLSRSMSNSSLSQSSKTNNNRHKRGSESFGLSKISNKIKGVFKTSTVEGKMVDEVDYTADEPDSQVKQQEGQRPSLDSMSVSLEDEIPDTLMEGDFPLRDLSAWRVRIPYVEQRLEPDSNKKMNFFFIIEVSRLDVQQMEEYDTPTWRVARRYNEFYVLEQKLTEFHGEFINQLLPPKKSFGSKGAEFLDSKRPAFEEFLQSLLTKHRLRSSELLFNFLTSENEFTTSILPDINLGKMFKSVPMKLVKERGQHLDSFLSSLLMSTESSKPKPSSWTESDSDSISISSEKLANSLFENNANIEIELETNEPQPVIDSTEVNGAFDTVVYLVRFVFRAPDWVHHILTSARMLLKNSVENYLDWYIGHHLEKISQEHRVILLVHLLRDVLFFDDDGSRTEDQKLQRKKEAFLEMKKFIPGVLVQAVGEKHHHEGTKLIFDGLQSPKLNKQLSYTFLDVALQELFPELTKEGSTSGTDEDSTQGS